MIQDSLMARYIELGIRFSMENDNLKVLFPKEGVNPEVLDDLRANKNLILEYLKGISNEKQKASIFKTENKEYYSLSSAQKRLYVLQQIDLSSVTYNIPLLFRIGDVSEEELERAVKKIVQRHDSFRTSFRMVDDEPQQIISDTVPFEIKYQEVSSINELNNSYMQFIRPFKLDDAPLLRVSIVKVADHDSYLLADMHHIISDGVSMAILKDELMKLLAGYQLDQLRMQYTDYSEWQSSAEQKNATKKQEEYWVRLFSDEVPVLNLPYDYPRPATQCFEGASVNFSINEENTSRIRKLCTETRSTQSMYLIAIYYILLSKLSGQEDIIIGLPIAGRRNAELNKIIGMFVNTLAVRNYPKVELSFIEFLLRVKNNMLLAYENQEYQFEKLVDKISLARDLSRNPIFDACFDMLNIQAIEESLESTEEPMKHINGIAKFDITLTAFESTHTINIGLEYCTKLFKQDSIERFISYFRQIIILVTSNPDITISELDILSLEEKHQLLYVFNDTKTDYPKDKIIHQLFEEQAKITPDSIAVVFLGEQISYSELNEKANQLAYTLRRVGVIPNSIVGLYGDRTPQIIIALIAILKAGGAFLPISASTVINRIENILNESKMELFLAQSSLVNKLIFKGVTIDIEDEQYYSNNKSNIKNVNKVDDLAYVIYTSGSSGTPKGVMVEHKNYINVHYAWREKYGLTNKYFNLLQLASFNFDVFAGDLARTLFNGGKMIICSDENRLDLDYLIKVMLNHRINILESTPALIIPLLELGYRNGVCFDDLELIIIGSDSLNLRDYINIQKMYGRNKRIINSYGVTEATIDTSFYEEEYNTLLKGDTPIGKPMPNMSFYVLDSNKRLQPIGVAGELYIGGEGVARGYLHKPELTKEKFINHPYKQGERLYRTGDLAQWLPDGNMLFLGRIDNQVKIRGFRIELGEIENQLINIEKIKEAVVIAKDDNLGQKYLVAYIVSEEEVLSADLRMELSKNLPDYMIPTHFVRLEKIPLTSNRKIDKKSLPTPVIKVKDYISPSNEIEKELVEIWSDVLGITKEKISIDTNFFELGGHSISIIKLNSKIRNKLRDDVTVMDLFRYTTVNSQALLISNGIFNLPDNYRTEEIIRGNELKRQRLKKLKIVT